MLYEVAKAGPTYTGHTGEIPAIINVSTLALLVHLVEYSLQPVVLSRVHHCESVDWTGNCGNDVH